MNSTSIVILAAGFMAGVVICRFYQEHLAYAAEEGKEMPVQDISATKVKKTKDGCVDAYLTDGTVKHICGAYICNNVKLYNGKTIEVCNIKQPHSLNQVSSNAVPGSLATGKDADPRSDPLHPSKAKDEKGYAVLPGQRTLDYPTYYPGDSSPLVQEPERYIPGTRTVFGAYARAYAVEINCDKPFPWTPHTIAKFLTSLPPSQRAAAKRAKETEWKLACKKVGRDIKNAQLQDEINPFKGYDTMLKYPSQIPDKFKPQFKPYPGTSWQSQVDRFTIA